MSKAAVVSALASWVHPARMVAPALPPESTAQAQKLAPPVLSEPRAIRVNVDCVVPLAVCAAVATAPMGVIRSTLVTSYQWYANEAWVPSVALICPVVVEALAIAQ